MTYSNGIFIFSSDFKNIFNLGMFCFYAITIIYSLLVAIFFKKVFEKRGKEGWRAFIPFYNLLALIKCVEMPLFYSILFFLPLTNLFIIVAVNLRLTLFFGHEKSYMFGMIFMPFYAFPMLTVPPKVKTKVEKKETVDPNANGLGESISLKDASPNLLTQSEYDALNKQVVDESGVDSIFKSDIEMMEEVAAYKASSSAKNLLDDRPVEAPKKIQRVEEVEVRDIRNEQQFIKDEDVLEIIDL